MQQCGAATADDDAAHMQEELTRSLNAKDAALTKAQKEATKAAADADRSRHDYA